MLFEGGSGLFEFVAKVDRDMAQVVWYLILARVSRPVEYNIPKIHRSHLLSSQNPPRADHQHLPPPQPRQLHPPRRTSLGKRACRGRPPGGDCAVRRPRRRAAADRDTARGRHCRIAGRAPDVLAVVLTGVVEIDGWDRGRASARLRHRGEAKTHRDRACRTELAGRRDGWTARLCCRGRRDVRNGCRCEGRPIGIGRVVSCGDQRRAAGVGQLISQGGGGKERKEREILHGGDDKNE